jgi:hypothetical protein
MAQPTAYHIVESGRIRVGHQVPIEKGPNKGKPMPKILTEFRLTSNSKPALETIAQRYGGTVQPWTVRREWRGLVRAPAHAWEVYTTSDMLDVIIEANMLMTRHFEQWRGAACILRCDGETITKDATGRHLGQPCTCPEDPELRKELAKRKPPEACEQVSRLQVFLEGIPGGQWRVDTHGFYADAETRGLIALLRTSRVDQMLIPARLRLERRTDTKASPNADDARGYSMDTRNYVCVVIEPRYALDQIMLAGEQQRLLLPPHSQTETKTLAEHIADIGHGPPATDPLRQRIDRLLLEQGVAAEGIAAYWDRMTRRYPDLADPQILSMLYEGLLDAAEKKQGPLGRPDPPLDPEAAAESPAHVPTEAEVDVLPPLK